MILTNSGAIRKMNAGTLVISGAARYLGGYREVPEVADGLLYIMKNGLYFENFPHDHWLNRLFDVKAEFRRVFFHLKNEQIAEISCFPGQRNKIKASFGERLLFQLGLRPPLLTVDYRAGGEVRFIRFSCVQSPLPLCAAYYQARDTASGESLLP